MKQFWQKFEHYNAKCIPYAIVVLLFVIVVELFYKDFAEHYSLYIHILDNLVLLIFIIDLVFLAIHARSVKFFFQRYWLDILAVIPVGLMFTVVNSIYRAVIISTSEIVVGQGLLHESIEARKGIEALSKSEKVTKEVRVMTRGVRAITKSRFFQELKFRHHHIRKHPDDRKKVKIKPTR